MRRLIVLALFLSVSLLGCPRPEGPRRFITDDQGRAMILHGVNLSGSAKGDPLRMPWTTQADVARLSQDWGFNFVRFLILWDGLEPAARGQYDAAYLDRVAERVQQCADAGLSVVLDMHQDLYAIQFYGDGAPPWATLTDGLPFMPVPGPWWLNYAQPAVGRAFDNFWRNKEGVRDAYADAWLQVVARFKDNPAVIGYDLMNEPFGGTSNLAHFEDTHLTQFYQKLIDKIRVVDPDTWIFYEPAAIGINFGMGSRLGLLHDPRDGEPRLAYFPHFYQVNVHEGGDYDGNTVFIDLWEKYRAGEANAQGAPMFLGEFGAFAGRPTHNQYLRDVLAMVDRAGSGWTYWSYDLAGGFSFLDNDRNERSQLQELVRVYPQRIAGEPVSYSYDPATRAFELTFNEKPSPIAGPFAAATEIYIPAKRYYKDGWSVIVSDPEGAWSSTWDAAREVLSVTTDPTQSQHTIRIEPTPIQ